MAYCVHCGVKLGDAESVCPLCGTPVIDPSEPERVPAEKSFPSHTPEQKLTMSRRYLLSLFTVTMLVPAGLCLLIDLLTSGRVTWSAYPSVALSLLFFGAAVPVLVKKYKLRLSIAVDGLMLSLYLFMCERMSQTRGWFFPVALPALALGCLMLLVLISMYTRKKTGILTSIAASFLCVAILCLFIELLSGLAFMGAVSLTWSPFVIAPCVFLSALLFFINGYKPLREEMRRRMHF
jgi:hypothetical protein